MHICTNVCGNTTVSQNSSKEHPLISLYSVKVYSNERPPWSKLCVANEAEFEKQRGSKQYFIKGYYKVAFNALCRRI